MSEVFEQEEDPASRSFFSEIISSISDVRFSHDGRYILSRDYLTVKIWDINMERQPVKTIPIHEHLRPRLCDTYENDSIFDKFEVVFSGDAKNVMTGSYNNNFMIYPSDPDKDLEVVLQADKSAFKAKKVGVPTPINSSAGTANGKKSGSRAGSPGAGQRMRKETDADQIDFNKKILHMSWHPYEDSIAIAATNNVSTDKRVPRNAGEDNINNTNGSCSCSPRSKGHHVMGGDERCARLFRGNDSSAYLRMDGLGIGGAAGHMNRGLSPAPGQPRALWPSYRPSSCGIRCRSHYCFMDKDRIGGEGAFSGAPMVPFLRTSCSMLYSHMIGWVWNLSWRR